MSDNFEGGAGKGSCERKGFGFTAEIGALSFELRNLGKNVLEREGSGGCTLHLFFWDSFISSNTHFFTYIIKVNVLWVGVGGLVVNRMCTQCAVAPPPIDGQLSSGKADQPTEAT